MLGTDTEARITVTLVESGRRISNVRLYTNVGTLGDPYEGADGGFSAIYQAPAELYPHVAIIAATADLDGQPVMAWLRLPLFGSAKI